MSISFALLDENGQIEEASGPALPIYSITKTFIAALIVELKIDLQQKISKWITLDECKNADQISVLHLLNHSSGIVDYIRLPEYIDAVSHKQRPWGNIQFSEYTTNKDLLFEPGSDFYYCNAGYHLLKLITERESQKTLDTLIEELIQTPLDLGPIEVLHGVTDPSLPEGYHPDWVWHGLLKATALDVAKFMRSKMVANLNQNLIKINQVEPNWVYPHYGLGLMVDPQIQYGHFGSGPGYQSACLVNLKNHKTCCAIVSINQSTVNAVDMVVGCIK